MGSIQVPHSWRDASGARRLHWAYFTAAALMTGICAGSLAFTGTRVWQLKREYNPDSPDPAIEQDFNRYKLASNVLVGITIAAGVSAVALAVFTRWRKREDKPAVLVLPAATPGGAALVLLSTF